MFTALFVTRALYGFFRNKVEGACDDLIQRTFLRCVESVNRFRGDSSFRTYLFGTGSPSQPEPS